MPTWSPEQLDALNRLTTVARLLSTAVHETGNALQVISGNAEMIAAKPDDAAKTGERAHRIKVQSDQVGARLQALAALAAAEPGPPRRLDLRRLVDRAVDLRRYSLNRTGIAVTVDGLDRGPVLGDESELLRLVANLILNAERAVHDRRAPAIHLTLSDLGGSMSLTVADNGPGVSQGQVESIFQAFASDRAPGCGLAVARWLAERHGGALVLDSAHSGGARFVLTLPAIVLGTYSSELSPIPSR